MQTRIFGYSALTPSEILTSVDLGRSQVERPGDWTVAEENDSGELLRLASSTVAVTPCFLAMDVKRRLHVGATVFDVARQADLPWDWNRRAVECLALFGHTIGSDTLHPKVSRVANDIYLPEPVSSLAERPLGSWLPTKSGSTSHEDALAVLRRVFRRDAGGSKVLLSLSAGYDSRLLLSLCLDLGIHPRCVTTGFAQSTDVVVAEAICREFGLPHERIELCPDDYLAEGNTIAYLTNGSALASHWHTYLYARAAASSAAEIHLVGSNGEYARNFYIPRRGQFAILERSPGSLLPLYWATRLERRRAHFRSLPLIAAHGPKESWKIARSIPRTGGNLGQALAHFFVTQRVRHFIGNGLALYGAVGRPRVPFLDAEVVRAIRGLDSKEFRRDRFHTRAIQDLEPKLVEFPFNKPIASGMTTLPISPFPSVLSKLKTHDVIMEHSNLDDLISQGDRGAALREGDAATVELLLTLAFAARVAEMRLGSKRP